MSELKNPEERFKKIHDVRTQRLAEPADSVHRKGSICEQVPAEYSSDMKYGYHRECYQKFTVLEGKQYSRAMVCHKTMLEALERLLINAYLVDRGRDSLTGSMNDESQLLIQDVVEAPSKVTVNNATGDETIHNLIDDYAYFKDEVRGGKLGKTAQLWLS